MSTTDISRRKLLFSGGAFATTASLAAKGMDLRNKKHILPIEIIRDPHFRLGANMWSAEDVPVNQRKRAGALCPTEGSCNPVWDGAQWYSHYNLGGATRTLLHSGAIEFEDESKSLTFGSDETPEADIIFALNARKEFQDIAPVQPGGWPHLLMEQTFLVRPQLVKLERASLSIDYRLLHSVAHKGPGWNDARHTAQFQMYFTLQNNNPKSLGFKDYLWFGVPLYDARRLIAQPYSAEDVGNAQKRATSKFIFSPGGAVYSTVSASTGQWISIRKDILPLMNNALDSAWKAGFLSGSRHREDYVISGMNIGWEITGPIDAAMQVRGLGLQVVEDSINNVP